MIVLLQYVYSITGLDNTSTAFANPNQTDFKVYASSIAFGTDQRFDQVICESISLKGAVADNNASAQATAGTSASAFCNEGKEVR
jgi:hypothetical protein